MIRLSLTRLLVAVVALDVLALVVAFALRHARHGAGETIGAIAWFALWADTLGLVALAVILLVRRRRLAGTAATLTLAVLLVAATAALAAAGSQTQQQRFLLYTANVRGSDAPVVVEASGAINGLGSETQTERETARGQINTVTLHLARGTIRLLAPERFAWKPDLVSCSATANGGGSWKITGGSGAYRGLSGHGTFTSHGVLLGARNAKGACLGEKAPPAVNYVAVTLTGTIKR